MHTEEQARKTRCCGPWPCGIPDDSNGINSVQRLCVAADCMGWEWVDRKYEYIRTLNLTDDQEKMIERIKLHPGERAVWKRPDGEPLPPPGEGWMPAGDMENARGFLDGVFDRRWKRPRPNQCGDCGLKRKQP